MADEKDLITEAKLNAMSSDEVSALYQDFLTKVDNSFSLLKLEAGNGFKNQTAGLRARKLAMNLRAQLKDFRIISTANDKRIRKDKKETKTQ